ncbi:class I SAM-dependent methyltransferase [Luteipulveratus flavus]|uniref:Class I SAM-dependent methyltransferase n=1 Tax=Luteipulveratus flavus TaxID=3031728 RepID=A0ABT6C3A4_9MICO|nr:class I SAM-dependent methyltransferase [Luteipulveratus sp. YIM 133296]MDF8263170.1 class I SAM-dependent methyltransferase [Luteipulveratus sp. YIM 133296]
MDLALVRRLTSGEGWGLLQSLPPYDAKEALGLGVRLREAGFPADLVAAALTQSELRARAADKLGSSAAEMLLTRDGLEQATRRPVAEAHARRFAEAGVRHVLDLGCGIGSDAMAFADCDLQVDAVDADEVTAAIAAVNLRPWEHARVEHMHAEQVSLPRGEAARGVGVWLDPARRTPGVADISGRTRRLFRLEDLSPSWHVVRDIAGRAPAVAAKLSPAFPHAQLPAGAEAEWVSYDGEVVECAVWWGSLVRRPGRTAHVLGPRVDAVVTEADAVDADPTLAELGRLNPYLYEPDRAIIRSGLVGALVNAVGGRELATGLGYVNAAHELRLPWARRYAVTDVIPYNVKGLRALLRDRDAGRVTIKKRGVSIDADQLRRQLRLSGSQEVTVVLTRLRQAQVALVVTPF